MGGLSLIAVEIVLALEDRQVLRRMTVPSATRVGELLTLSGLQEEVADQDLSRAPVGIFGRLCTLDTPLRAGDRVEIYRSLQADPKAARRQRAARKSSRPRS